MRRAPRLIRADGKKTCSRGDRSGHLATVKIIQGSETFMDVVVKPTLLPWRYLVPRRGYFRQARAARVCPEISAHLDHAAFYAALWPVTVVPAVLIGALALL